MPRDQVPEGAQMSSGDQQGSSNNIEALLDLNALQYDCMPDLSVAIDRSYKNSYFQKGTYQPPGQVAYCILNSGADFINPRTSYISLDVSAKAAVADGGGGALTRTYALWPGSGGAWNLIKSIRILDRAGNELEYIYDVNVLANMMEKVRCSEVEYNTTESASTHAPFSSSGVVAAVAAGETAIGYMQRKANYAYADDLVTHRWLIPLRKLSGLFDYPGLLPAQLCSGLRIQIEWEASNRAFSYINMTKATGVVTQLTDTQVETGSFGYQISNARVVLDSVRLTDSITRQLNQRSATDGLEIQFRTWFNSTYSATSNTANIETRRAVSRAFGALAHIRGIKTAAITESEKDSMATTPADLVRWQWRAGNLYFPQQAVTQEGASAATTSRDVAKETLHHMMQYAGKLENPINEPGLSYDDYINGGLDSDTFAVNETDSTSYAGGMALIPVNLERSSVQDVSGLPLNNSRVLCLDIKFDDSTVYDSKEIRVFLQYLKVARVFMDNTEMEE